MCPWMKQVRDWGIYKLGTWFSACLQPVPGWILCVCACVYACKGNLSYQQMDKGGRTQAVTCPGTKNLGDLRSGSQFIWIDCLRLAAGETNIVHLHVRTQAFCTSGLCLEQPEVNRMCVLVLYGCSSAVFFLPLLTHAADHQQVYAYCVYVLGIHAQS